MVRDRPCEKVSCKLILEYQRDGHAKTIGKAFQSKGNSKDYVYETKEEQWDNRRFQTVWGDDLGVKSTVRSYGAPGLQSEENFFFLPIQSTQHLGT